MHGNTALGYFHYISECIILCSYIFSQYLKLVCVPWLCIICWICCEARESLEIIKNSSRMIMRWLYLISLQIKIALLNYSNMAMSKLVEFFSPPDLYCLKKNSIHSIHIIQSMVSTTIYNSVTPDLYFQAICSFEFQMHISGALLDISTWLFHKYSKLSQP